ncbi:MAG TPA: serine/threonine-protein kinase [Calditrichia bacterium]|nr:serine/threonine-protein kinase [Calditrichia bacterium]
MDSQRWQRIQNIFGEVADLSHSQCQARLLELCQGDAELLGEVKSLLEADQTDHPILDGIAADSLDEILPKMQEGKTVGNYKLIRELGAGGMGTVYLANRADGLFDQEVAIKMIRPSLLSERALKRFRNERQILARLKHPHIAQLYDGGITEDGIPFFTMEYIEGLPVSEYCRENQLGIRSRLKLFLDICEAVRYAHQNLIIHRDLKPGNILVNARGKVKLLDFGIARLSEPGEGEEHSTQTRPGERVLTPQYAAPEQILGEPVTVAADVYALGIVLYELLCNRRPFQGSENDLFKIHASREITIPDPPSKVLEAHRRQKDGQTHFTARELNRDLDNICLMALRREPERRYQSVQSLQEDIRRYLKGQPVHARKPTLGYRTQRFIKRNKKALAVTTVAGLSLVATVLWYSVQLTAERDRALAEAQKSARIAAFLTSIFEVADPYLTNGDTLTAGTILKRGAEKMALELGDQPETKASLLSTMAAVYLNLGLPAQAQPLIDSALVFYQSGREPDTEMARAWMVKGDLHLLTGEYPASREAYQRAQQTYVQLDEAYRLKALEALACVGRTLAKERRDEAAEAVFREVISGESRLLPEDDPQRSEALENLGRVLRHSGRYGKARRVFQQVYDIRKSHFGEQHISVANVLHEMGMLYQRRRSLDSAGVSFRASLEIAEKVYGEDHPEVATSLQVLADLRKDQERYQEAEALIRRALDIRLKRLGSQHPLIATTRDFMARILRRQGRLEEALNLHLEALALKKEVWGERHTSTANTLNNLGRVYSDLGDEAAAARYYRQAWEIYVENLGPQYPDAATALHNLARALMKQGRYAEAEPLMRQSAVYQAQLMGAGHRRATNELGYLADCQIALGNLAAADSTLQLKLSLHQPGEGSEGDPEAYRETRERLQELARRRGLPAEGKP